MVLSLPSFRSGREVIDLSNLSLNNSHSFNLFGGFPGDSDGKEPACNAGDLGSVPGLGRSTQGMKGEGNGYPLQYASLENSLDRGAWQAIRSWGHKESDTTEQLSLTSLEPSILPVCFQSPL